MSILTSSFFYDLPIIDFGYFFQAVNQIPISSWSVLVGHVTDALV